LFCTTLSVVYMKLAEQLLSYSLAAAYRPETRTRLNQSFTTTVLLLQSVSWQSTFHYPGRSVRNRLT